MTPGIRDACRGAELLASAISDDFPRDNFYWILLRVRPWDGLGTSFTLHPPILVEESISGHNYGSLALQPADLLSPCRSRPRFRPAYGDFYIRASGGLVTRTAAGHDYSGNWASSTDGTYYSAPARTPTSIPTTHNQTSGPRGWAVVNTPPWDLTRSRRPIRLIFIAMGGPRPMLTREKGAEQ